jgi:ferredoxin
MFRVTVLPSVETFETAPDQTLLDAALAAGVLLPKSCRNGTCRACRCRLLRGTAEHVIEWPGLSREEKVEGWILPCVLRVLSDCVLDTSPG